MGGGIRFGIVEGANKGRTAASSVGERIARPLGKPNERGSVPPELASPSHSACPGWAGLRREESEGSACAFPHATRVALLGVRAGNSVFGRTGRTEKLACLTEEEESSPEGATATTGRMALLNEPHAPKTDGGAIHRTHQHLPLASA